MKKLDEIERGLKRSLSTAYCGDSPNRKKHEDRIDLLIRAVRHLGEVRNELEQLINESRGVDGIHLNGDLATWDELINGADGVSWLDAFSAPQDDVLELIEQAND